MRRIRRLALAGAAALVCGRARGEPPAFLLKERATTVTAR